MVGGVGEGSKLFIDPREGWATHNILVLTAIEQRRNYRNCSNVLFIG